MTRTRMHRAIVLKSFDVGDADRFCILFTREQGRIAARANGARKLLSRFHALQPGCVLAVELSGNGPQYRITGVTREPTLPLTPSVTSFTRSQKGLEILLSFVQDDDAFPTLFDDTTRFLVLCHQEGADPVPAFTARVLSLMGMLPTTGDDLRYARLHEEDRHAVQRATDDQWYENTPLADVPGVRRFIDHVLMEHVSSPLRAGGIATLMLA